MDGRDQMLKGKVKGAAQEVILPDFPDDDNTATTTVTKSRRVSFGTNFIKEFIVGSAVSAQCASEYEQAFSSSDSSNANSSHSAVESEIFSQNPYVLEEDFKMNQITSEVSRPKISSTICFSADSPTADMEFTEGCISLAKSILDKKNKEMTVIIQAKPKESKEETKRRKDDETKYFEGSQVEMSMTKCFRSKENKLDDKKEKRSENEKTRIFNNYDGEMSVTRCDGIWSEVESKENKMPLDVIMRHLDKDNSDVENFLFHPEKSLSDVLNKNPFNNSNESEKLNLNESMDISGNFHLDYFKISQPMTPKIRKEDEVRCQPQRLSDPNEFFQQVFLRNEMVIEDVSVKEKAMEKDKDSFFESLNSGLNLRKESQEDVDMEISMQKEIQQPQEATYNYNNNNINININNNQSEVFLEESKLRSSVHTADSPKIQSSDASKPEIQTEDIIVEPKDLSLTTETQMQDMIVEPEALFLTNEIRKPVTHSHDVSIESDLPVIAKSKEFEKIQHIITETEVSLSLKKSLKEPEKKSDILETSYSKTVDELEKPLSEKIDKPTNNSEILSVNKGIVVPEKKPVGKFTVSGAFPSAATPEKIKIDFNGSELFPSTARTSKPKELTPEKFTDVVLPEISSPTTAANDPTLENIICAAGQSEAHSFTTAEMNELEKEINATDLSDISFPSGTEGSKNDSIKTVDVSMHSLNFPLSEADVQKPEEIYTINQSVEIKPPLIDIKVVENLKAQSAEPGCVWVLENLSFPQNQINGLLAFKFQLLESLMSIKFWLKGSEEKTCSSVSTSEIFLNEEKHIEVPEYRLVIDMGFEKLRKEFEKERKNVRTIRQISYFLDHLNFFISKISPYLRQVYSILTLYPGSRLRGSVLSFRLYSFPILFSCTISIDLFDFHRLSSSSLSFNMHFGEFDRNKIFDIFEESLKCENMLCEFVIKCNKYIIDIEKEIGYVSKRKHIRLLPPDFAV